jgi:hypothetical protein
MLMDIVAPRGDVVVELGETVDDRHCGLRVAWALI